MSLYKLLMIQVSVLRLSFQWLSLTVFYLDMWIIYIIGVILFIVVIFIVQIMEEDLPCLIEAMDKRLKSEIVI